MKPQAAEGATCQDQESINWKQCMLCQSDADKEELVKRKEEALKWTNQVHQHLALQHHS